MIGQVLANYHLPLLSCVGLLIFLAVFCGSLFWVFRKGSAGFYATLQDLPFQDKGAEK